MTMTTIKHAICATLGLAIFASPAVADEGETIGAIKERGELVCGTSTGTAIGLSTLDDSGTRSEEHTSELQSLLRISYAVFCLTKKTAPNSRTKLHIKLLT